MRANVWKLSLILFVGVGLVAGCSGGGGGKESPFPKEVRDLFDDLEDAFRSGVADIPITITCAATIGNPFDLNNGSGVEDINGNRDHDGTVQQASWQETEIRNSNGSGSMTFTIVDTADPLRLFYGGVGTFKAPKIKFVPPPIGAKDFLAADGTGQSFAIVTHERTINFTRSFENDPVGGMGTGTLVNFFGPPVVPTVPDGSGSVTVVEKETYLIEFDILAPGSACVVGITPIGDVETVKRKGSGNKVSPLVHEHDVTAQTVIGPVEALKNKHAVVLPVGTDALPLWLVVDGDDIDLMDGIIKGGIAGFPAVLNQSSIDDAGGAVTLVSDGVGDPLDGNFDSVATYLLDNSLSASSGPGGVGNGTVEVSVLVVQTQQEEDPAMDIFDHRILDEFLLYGEEAADTETGVILFR